MTEQPAHLDNQPLNELEEQLARGEQPDANPVDVILAFLNNEVYVVSSDALEGPDSQVEPLVLANSSGKPVLAVFSHPSRVTELRPTTAGWLSHEDGLGFLFDGPGHLRYDRPIKRRVEFLEGGNYNTAGLAGLEASLDLIQQIGVPAIHEHVNRYIDALEAGLVARGFKSLRAADERYRSCTLGLLPPPGVSVVDLQRELGERGIICALPDGVLRFTPHWPNNLSEIPFVLESVDQVLSILHAT